MQPRLSTLWKNFAAFEQARALGLDGGAGAGMGMGMRYDGAGGYEGGLGYEGVYAQDVGFDMSMGMGMGVGAEMGMGMGQYQPGLENMFEHASTGTAHDPAMMPFGFEFNELLHE
jgi:hypothetical protein